MKNKKSVPSAEDLYSEYRQARDTRPSADLGPILQAANDALSARGTTTVDLDPQQSWEGRDESSDVSQLYREWKSARVLPGELAEIRERIVTRTVAVALANSQIQSNALREAKPGQKEHCPTTISAKIVEFFDHALSHVAFAPAVIAASIFALVIVLAPVGNQTGFDESRLAGVSVLDRGHLAQSDGLEDWILSGIDSNFGFSKSTSRQGRAFGLGVGSMDLVMALRSGSADKTLEVSRHLVGLSQVGVAQGDELGLVKTSATAVFDEVSSHREVSRSVFARSMHLLTEMKDAFVFDHERALFELGQWVEAVYLLSSSSIETGDTESLHQLLTSAKTHFASGARLKGLSEHVSTSLASLSGISVDDGVVLAEARLARDLSQRIKSLVE